MRSAVISDLLAAQGKDNQLTDLNELQAEETYLFGFCAPNGAIYDPSRDHPGSSGHVMITEPGALEQLEEGYKIGVVEATAAGNRELRYLDYTITGATKAQFGAVFQVLREHPPTR